MWNKDKFQLKLKLVYEQNIITTLFAIYIL